MKYIRMINGTKTGFSRMRQIVGEGHGCDVAFMRGLGHNLTGANAPRMTPRR